MPGELPTLDFSRRVTAQEARQDKLQLEIEGWSLSGSTEDLDFFRKQMSVPDANLRRGVMAPEIPGNFSHLFNRPGNARGWRKPMELRGERPAWAGKWVFSPYGNQNVHLPVNTSTHFEVSVNPTRFVRYLRFRRVPASNEFIYLPTFYKRTVVKEVNGEFPLDDNDNWLPQGDSLEFSSAERWPSLLQTCFTGFLNHFESELARIIARHENRVSMMRGPRSFNLQTTETYFEFAAESPMTEVARLESELRIFARRACEAEDYECRDVRTGQIFHSRCIRAELGKGRELVVYAKTNRRVRFEVRHNMVASPPFTIPTGAAPSARSRGRGGTHVPTSHVARSWVGLVRMFDFIAGDAANVINRFFAFAQSRQSVTPSRITALVLIERILRRVPDRGRAIELIRMLAQDGAIRANVLPSGYDADICALIGNGAQAGIIQLSRGTPAQRTYIVAPQYNAAALRLRELAEPPPPPPPPPPQARVRLPAPTPQI